MCVPQEKPVAPSQTIRAASLRRLFDHWLARRQPDGRPPLTADIDLADLPHSLANIVLLDIPGANDARATGRRLSNHEFVFKYIGSSIVMRYRRDLTGGTLQDLIFHHPATPLFVAAVHQAAAEQDMVATTLPLQDTPMPDIDIVVLPLVNADGTVAQILIGSQIVGRPVALPPTV